MNVLKTSIVLCNINLKFKSKEYYSKHAVKGELWNISVMLCQQFPQVHAYLNISSEDIHTWTNTVFCNTDKMDTDIRTVYPTEILLVSNKCFTEYMSYLNITKML